MNGKNRGLKFVVVALAFAVFALTAAAQAYATQINRYTYVGNPFTDFFPDDDTNPFRGSRLTGSFDVDCSSLSSAGDCASIPFSDYFLLIDSFEFEAGPVVINNDTPTTQTRIIEFSTDGNMEIVDWEIALNIDLSPIPVPISASGLNTRSIGPLGFFDQGFINFFTTFGNTAQNIPGSWSVSVVSVPEPSTLTNVLVSLAALLLLLWRLRAWPVRVYGRPQTP